MAVKEKRIDRINKIDETFTKRTYRRIIILSALAVFFVGVAFQLTDNPTSFSIDQISSFVISLFWPPFIFIPVGLTFYVIPEIILAMKLNKHESQKLEEVSTYMEQMLYSFKKNSKILSSLLDTREIFQDCHMRDKIDEAIEYIRNGQTTNNIYKEALQIIEKEYNCRRLRSLHRFMVKVEGVGGEFEMGVGALLDDRRLWLERLDDFRKKRSATIKDILIATIFSTVVIIITLYMLPSQYPVAKHIILRLAAVVYMSVSMLNIKAVFKRTVLYVNDIEDKEHGKLMAEKFVQYRKFNLKKESLKGLKAGLILLGFMILASVLLFIMNNTGMIKYTAALGVLGFLFAWLVQPKLKFNSLRKSLIAEVEKVYPDWLLELSLLLQTKNLHVALEETIKTSPLVIRQELRKLSDEIALNPTSIEPYGTFLQDLPLPNVHSSMKLLYSISEYGSDEEINQISELIKRNAALMNRAEERKNEERLAKVFMLKFIPMAVSAIKMIVDMFVFLIVFMQSAV